MVVTYNYKSAKSILESFLKNEVSGLIIVLDDSLGKENQTYILSSVLVSQYPEHKQEEVRSLFNPKTVHFVEKAAKVLEQFIEEQEKDNIEFFDFHFDITTMQFNYQISLKDNSTSYEEENIADTMEDITKRLEHFIQQKDIEGMIVPGLFQKAPASSGQGKQKGPRQLPVTVNDLVAKLKQIDTK